VIRERKRSNFIYCYQKFVGTSCLYFKVQVAHLWICWHLSTKLHGVTYQEKSSLYAPPYATAIQLHNIRLCFITFISALTHLTQLITISCEIWGTHSGADVYSGRLEYGALSTFRSREVLKVPGDFFFFPERGSQLLRNDGNYQSTRLLVPEDLNPQQLLS